MSKATIDRIVGTRLILNSRVSRHCANCFAHLLPGTAMVRVTGGQDTPFSQRFGCIACTKPLFNDLMEQREQQKSDIRPYLSGRAQWAAMLEAIETGQAGMVLERLPKYKLNAQQKRQIKSALKAKGIDYTHK